MEKETFDEAIEKTFTSINEYKELKLHLYNLYHNLNRIFPMDTSILILNKILNFDLSFLNRILVPVESNRIFRPFITQNGGKNYNYIIHPRNYNKIPVYSKRGKKIIIKYIENLLYHLN